MTSQLDTSGVVLALHPPGAHPSPPWHAWTDLPNNFVRGYIEAMKRARRLIVHRVGDELEAFDWTFSDLAPETLETILKDCARFFSEGYGVAEDDAFDGAMLWRTRQAGEWADVAFPPQTLILSDDGKVRFQ